MQDLRVSQVTKVSDGNLRGSRLIEYNVVYLIDGKMFEVTMFQKFDPAETYLQTASLDNAVAHYSGRNYFSMNGEKRGKVRKEIEGKIINLATKYLNK